jgi:hypothetical protein
MRCVAPLQCGHMCLLHNGSYLYDRPYDISRDLICTAGRTCMRTPKALLLTQPVSSSVIRENARVKRHMRTARFP